MGHRCCYFMTAAADHHFFSHVVKSSIRFLAASRGRQLLNNVYLIEDSRLTRTQINRQTSREIERESREKSKVSGLPTSDTLGNSGHYDWFVERLNPLNMSDPIILITQITSRSSCPVMQVQIVGRWWIARLLSDWYLRWMTVLSHMLSISVIGR